MANFHSYERLFREALAATEDSTNKFALEIYGLPETQKVLLVKNRSAVEIEAYLKRCRTKLQSFFDSKAIFSTSSNNSSGKDLLEINSGIEIELKSGLAKTDANNGLGLIAWTLSDNTDDLKNIMSESMKTRRALYSQGHLKLIEKSKEQTMDEIFKYFNSKLEKDKSVPERMNHFARCVSKGLTKEKEIKESFSGNTAEQPLLLESEWETGLKVYSKSFLPTEKILVQRIERNIERTQLILVGEKSKTTARIYPNYKNSWHSADGRVKIDAKYWVQTACFHVWIDEHPSFKKHE